ncbi:MAG: hypothetical protein KGL39_30510 [Patescibacteria group bacterium]|nr:hypothetical protein [Patescibacteria group bacterium]
MPGSLSLPGCSGSPSPFVQLNNKAGAFDLLLRAAAMVLIGVYTGFTNQPE